MRKNYSELDHYDKYIEGNTVKKQERVWEPQHWEEKRRQNRKKRALQREIERERKHSRAFTLIQNKPFGWSSWRSFALYKELLGN